ncbi:hypothetical protein CEP54_005582 [Fusarium duplospermum]|uniref:Branchpoint-bridging protein n=1 Tax=Fusarium duplospermum TaxID=1325734 RepID=A0A428QBH4_9HYPO|nr:hypothetical protein CEP54_005582 [Fusarium duplospermum]
MAGGRTLEPRHHRCLEEERHQLVKTALRAIPAYRLPYDYRRSMTKASEEVCLPATDFPSVNLIDQILGPRGSSLKAMSAESSANILLRGREPLYCFVIADSQHKDVIETATSTAEHETKIKAQQLCDLVIVNGAFRDDEKQQANTWPR